MNDQTMPITPEPQPTYWPPQQTPAPKKKHTARTVALIVAGTVLAVCGISGIGALVSGPDTTTTGVISSDTTGDPTPEATTAAPAAKPAAPAAKPKPKPTTPAAAKPLSREQENAIQEARDYLDYQAFSRSGLIKQLSSEYGAGYPVKVATYAVDSLHVDWNQQAVKAAKEYLDYSEFSRSGLIRQLESKYGAGFTHAQAVYGVSKAGL